MFRPICLRLMERGRERQAAWVANQQKTTTIPAPPSTYVWGQQLPTALPYAHRSAPTDFPLLPPTATALRQPPITSLLSRRTPRTTRSTQTIAPLSTTPSSPRITSSPQQVLCTSSTQISAMPLQTSL